MWFFVSFLFWFLIIFLFFFLLFFLIIRSRNSLKLFIIFNLNILYFIWATLFSFHFFLKLLNFLKFFFYCFNILLISLLLSFRLFLVVLLTTFLMFLNQMLISAIVVKTMVISWLIFLSSIYHNLARFLLSLNILIFVVFIILILVILFTWDSAVIVIVRNVHSFRSVFGTRLWRTIGLVMVLIIAISIINWLLLLFTSSVIYLIILSLVLLFSLLFLILIILVSVHIFVGL